MLPVFSSYRNIPQTRDLIEKAFKEFIRINRLKKIKSTTFQGKEFLNEIQSLIIQIYQRTKMGELLPNGYTQLLSDFEFHSFKNSELHSLKLRKC